MQIRLERLRNTLNLLTPVIPRKTTIPITQNVLLGNGKAIATDLETAVTIDFPEATEQCLLPLAEILDLIELVPGHLNLELTCEKKVAKLSWPGGKAAYPVADYRDFPPVDKKEAPVVNEDVDGDVLIAALAELVPYTAVEKTRPVLNGVTLYLGKPAIVAGADGYQLGYRELPFTCGAEGTVIIPTAVIELLAYLWKKTPVVAQIKPGLIEQLLSKRMLTVAVGKNGAWVGFKFGTIEMISHAIVGSPPNHKSLIEANTPNNRVKVMASDLLQAVRRTDRIANAASGIVRMRWDSESVLEVYAQAEEIGQVATLIPCEALDGPGHIAINYKYLVEYCSGKDGQLTIGINAGSPVRFEHANTPITLIMPMAVEWN